MDLNIFSYRFETTDQLTAVIYKMIKLVDLVRAPDLTDQARQEALLAVLPKLAVVLAILHHSKQSREYIVLCPSQNPVDTLRGLAGRPLTPSPKYEISLFFEEIRYFQHLMIDFVKAIEAESEKESRVVGLLFHTDIKSIYPCHGSYILSETDSPVRKDFIWPLIHSTVYMSNRLGVSLPKTTAKLIKRIDKAERRNGGKLTVEPLSLLDKILDPHSYGFHCGFHLGFIDVDAINAYVGSLSR